jgi:hypothetical protein
LDGRDSIPGRGKNFYLLHNFQTGSGAYPTSYAVGTGELTIHFDLVPRSRIVELYLQFQIRLHGVVLKQVQGQLYLTFTLPTHYNFV